MINTLTYMLEIVDEKITNSEMKENLKQCIRYKYEKGFKFGQLTKFHYELFSGNKKSEISKVAAGIELFILSSDILDDLMDKDNDSAPWMHISEPEILNLSVGLIFLANHAVNQADIENKDEIRMMLNDMFLNSVNGQQEDIQKHIRNKEEYMRMIRLKSGSLVSASCISGALAANSEFIDDVRKYSECLGVIAQINNDIQGINKIDEKNDIFNKNITLPVLYLFEIDHKLTKQFYKNEISLDYLKDHYDLILSSGAIEYCLIIAEFEKEKAYSIIDNMTFEHREKIKIIF